MIFQTSRYMLKARGRSEFGGGQGCVPEHLLHSHFHLFRLSCDGSPLPVCRHVDYAQPKQLLSGTQERRRGPQDVDEIEQSGQCEHSSRPIVGERETQFDHDSLRGEALPL